MKEFLSRRQVPFRALPLAEADHLGRLAARNPALRTAPVTYIGDREIIGWDATALTEALEAAGIGTDERAVPSEYPMVGRSAAVTMPDRSVLVTSFLADTVTAIPLDDPSTDEGRRLRARHVPGRPIAATVVADAGAIGVVGCDSGLVTWLRAEDCTPLHGTIATSTTRVGTAPLDAIADPYACLAYVSVSESRGLAVIDPMTVGHASNGMRWVATEGQPGVLAFAKSRDLLFVRQRDGGTLVFEGDNLRGRPEDAAAGVLPTPPGRGLAVSADETTLLVPCPLGEHSGLYLYDLDGARVPNRYDVRYVATGDMPFGIASHPTEPVVYVSCFGAPALEVRDARSGELTSALAEPIIGLPGPARSIVVDVETQTLLVSCFDANSILRFDARTGRPLTPAAWTVPAGPRGIVVVDLAGMR